MGIFNKRDRIVLKELRKKNQEINGEISKEIDEIFEEIKEEYQEAHSLEDKFVAFADTLKSKLSNDESKLLDEFSNQIHKLNSTAKKSINSIRELARDHKKATLESNREFEEYLRD